MVRAQSSAGMQRLCHVLETKVHTPPPFLLPLRFFLHFLPWSPLTHGADDMHVSFKAWINNHMFSTLWPGKNPWSTCYQTLLWPVLTAALTYGHKLKYLKEIWPYTQTWHFNVLEYTKVNTETIHWELFLIIEFWSQSCLLLPHFLLTFRLSCHNWDGQHSEMLLNLLKCTNSSSLKELSRRQKP